MSSNELAKNVVDLIEKLIPLVKQQYGVDQEPTEPDCGCTPMCACDKHAQEYEKACQPDPIPENDSSDDDDDEFFTAVDDDTKPEPFVSPFKDAYQQNMWIVVGTDSKGKAVFFDEYCVPSQLPYVCSTREEAREFKRALKNWGKKDIEIRQLFFV